MARDNAPVQAGERKFRAADFLTLPEALDYAAAGPAGAQFYSARGDLLEAVTYLDLSEQARSLGRRMLSAGLAEGDRVALIAETDANFLRAFFACQYAGLVAVPMPLPVVFGGRAGYVEHIRAMLGVAKASALLSPAPFLDMVQESAEPFDLKMIGTFDLFDGFPQDGVTLPEIGQDNLSYLQFSSGSTRSPAGIAVTQRALMANLRGIAQHGLQIRAGDRCCSWLPFYHDMGLVGFLLAPVATQVPLDLIATREFARRPLIWPTIISRNGGTLSYSPSFGYDLCARRMKDGAAAAGLDLSKWRVAGIGGDMVRPHVLARFAEAFKSAGFRKEAFVASYGMAEATLGITFAPLDHGIETDTIDLDLLEQEARAVPVADGAGANGNGHARTRDFVLCGPVLPGHELEVRGSDGNKLPDREVGRIMFRGPSLMREYFNSREETQRVMAGDGWLDTGDLGFLLNDALVVTGRSKDLILANGRNIWPQDLEWLVEHEVEGVRNGDVAAFSVDGDEAENIVLLVQCRVTDQTARASLSQTVADTVRAAAGVNCSVVLVPHNSLPQTSSGKLSRARARQMYLDLAQAEPSNDRAAPRLEAAL
ncbi:MAG TPA: fatty acyl-AMP ligase [Alphaproteobacteria bacterium]|jgi:fatty-acyl-CoA synthase|nr:fatty acyl-AMP ligase [Alphaproteobacteria bacterium]